MLPAVRSEQLVAKRAVVIHAIEKLLRVCADHENEIWLSNYRTIHEALCQQCDEEAIAIEQEIGRQRPRTQSSSRAQRERPRWIASESLAEDVHKTITRLRTHLMYGDQRPPLTVSEEVPDIEAEVTRAQRTEGESTQPKDAPGSRRIIKTGRTEEEINAAAQLGFRPLVKPVKPSEEIHYMVAVFQDSETGEIELSGDVRGRGKREKVIDYTLYYPYHFPNPFAAYLLPRDLAVGEEVWLEDLIEDLVAVWGNQGYHPRLPAAPAVWNGTGFDILFSPHRDAPRWIG